MSKIRLVALGWVVLVIGLLAVHVCLPQRSGVLALTQVFEPYFVLTGLVACVLAVRVPGAPAKIAVVILVVATLVRYVPSWVSFPASATGFESLRVSTWNIEAGPDDFARTVTGIGNLDADIVGVQELQPEMALALSTDPTISINLPHQALMPHDETLGAGLLSRFPIVEQSSSMNPTYIRAVLQPPTQDPVVVFVVHSLPPRFVTLAGIPVALDTAERDADIAEFRSLVQVDLDRGRSVLVIGDINTTDREPAYTDLSRGLRDSHLDAGIGPGLTWRPDELKGIPFGMLRIDYAFATIDMEVASSTVDCSLPSDHCRLDTVFARVSVPGD